LSGHELRSPVNGTIGLISILKDELQGVISDENLELLDCILEANKTLLTNVNDFINSAKIDYSKESMALERVALDDIIDVTRREQDALAKQKEYVYR
jgi:K+-sensing histidine kinase KdpD